MTFEELQAFFLEGFRRDRIYRATSASANDRPQSQWRHTIYPWLRLDAIINELRAETPDLNDAEEDQLMRFSVRFVVDSYGAIWFAREGATGCRVPSHIQMKDLCVTAGRLVFSDDYTSITSISNQSGHFLPDANSLVWVVAVLIHNQAPLAERVTVGLLEANGQLLEVSFTPAQLLQALPTQINIERIHAVNRITDEPVINEREISMTALGRRGRYDPEDADDAGEEDRPLPQRFRLFSPKEKTLSEIHHPQPENDGYHTP